ncbi:hypothetical protein MNBD_ALPHA06-1382 [hydrothermal vent metagenome]|uniref:Uncharacterized protein n=1 Tax=hydrothermal vent metagenome TaxID=652676 RepID=A0A3B0RH79_9ZZZZ
MKNLIHDIVAKAWPTAYRRNALFLHPLVREFYQLLEEDNKSNALELFNSLEPSSQCLLVEALSELIPDDTFFDAFFDNGNGPSMACLLRGSLLLKRAWVYRGRGCGREISSTNYDNMQTALIKAYQSFDFILEDPSLGQEACARSIRVLMGLSDGTRKEIHAVHAQMRTTPRPHLLGEINYHLACCEKWGGSHEEMFLHARKTSRNSDTDPQMGALMAAAYWEKHMFIERFDEDEEQAAAYRSNQAMIYEVQTLSEKLLVVEPPEQDMYIVAHNVFAAFFCEVSRFDLARPHFQLLNQRLIRYPWEFFFAEDLQYMYNRSMLSG